MDTVNVELGVGPTPVSPMSGKGGGEGNQDHLSLVAPPAEVTVLEPPKPPPWWLAPEFLALAELRRAMVGGAGPVGSPLTAEESARDAVFWVLFELDHLLQHFVKRVEAGESLRIRRGIYKFHQERVDFNVRIVEHDANTIDLASSRGAR